MTPPVVPITAISTILLVVIAFQYVYEVEMPLRWHGQTPGKRLLKIALTSREPGVALSRSALTSRLLVMLAANVLSNCGIGLLDRCGASGTSRTASACTTNRRRRS